MLAEYLGAFDGAHSGSRLGLRGGAAYSLGFRAGRWLQARPEGCSAHTLCLQGTPLCAPTASCRGTQGPRRLLGEPGHGQYVGKGEDQQQDDGEHYRATLVVVTHRLAPQDLHAWR